MQVNQQKGKYHTPSTCLRIRDGKLKLARQLQVHPYLIINLQPEHIAKDSSVLSAAALRRRLLEKQASASPAQSPESGLKSLGTGPSTPTPNGTGSKAQGTPKGSAKKGASRTPEEVLVGDSGTIDENALYETTETLEEPPRKKIQLSSVSPSSSNIQRKADGTAVLKFPDSSEVFAPSSCLFLYVY